MNEDQFDDIFESAPQMPASLAEKIRAQIQQDTQPVRALPGTAILASSFFAIAAIIAIVLAAILKFSGLHVLPSEAAASMLGALSLTAAWGAVTVARSMRPASGVLQTWLISAVAFVAYELLVYQFFAHSSTQPFVATGIKCLRLGVICGAVVALPAWLLLRIGFVTHRVQAGAAIGLIGGLSGNILLTLHCPLLEAPHALVWHAGALVVCVALGALAGRFSPSNYQ